MLKISLEQMQAIEAGYRKRRREGLWRQFKLSYPILSKDIENEKGIRIISECIDDGKELDITESEDILRFSVLAFLPKHIRQDVWFSSMVIRILHNENLSANERLLFIFDNVIDNQYIS